MSKLRDVWLVLRGRLSFELAAQHKLNSMKAEGEVIYLTSQLRDLAVQLREVDQVLFTASQKPTQAEIVKEISPLFDLVMRRKLIESKRISDLLIPELERTYGQ